MIYKRLKILVTNIESDRKALSYLFKLKSCGYDATIERRNQIYAIYIKNIFNDEDLIDIFKELKNDSRI